MPVLNARELFSGYASLALNRSNRRFPRSRRQQSFNFRFATLNFITEHLACSPKYEYGASLKCEHGFFFRERGMVHFQLALTFRAFGMHGRCLYFYAQHIGFDFFIVRFSVSNCAVSTRLINVYSRTTCNKRAYHHGESMLRKAKPNCHKVFAKEPLLLFGMEIRFIVNKQH